MDHQLSESQEMLRRTAAGFFAHTYPLDRMREIYRRPPHFDARIWDDICRLGWNGAAFPADVGGIDGGLLDAAVLLEEMGRAACVSPYNHSTIPAGLALLEENRELAGRIVAGEAVVIPVEAGPQPAQAAPGLTVRNEAGRITLAGRIAGVRWATLASHVLLASPAKEPLLVDMHQDGIAIAPLAVMGGDPLFAVAFNGATATPLAREERLADIGLLGACANALLLLGLSERALDLAVAYAKERIQFGKPIGSFQAIQHKCADMHIGIETGRYLAYKAAWLRDNGEGFEREARYAKSLLGDVAAFVTRQAIQIHGGVGYVDDHPIQMFYTIAASTSATYGTAHEHRRGIADLLLDT